MGLLDQFAELDMVEMAADAEQIAREHAQQQAIVATRRQIVSDAIHAFAAKHGYACQEISTSEGTQTFIVEDIVLIVHEQMMLATKDVELINRHDVLLQYFVYLVGIDRVGSVRQCKIGTLLFLTFDGIRREYGQHLGYEFSQKHVVPVLFQT